MWNVPTFGALNILHPDEIRTFDLLFWRRRRWPRLSLIDKAQLTDPSEMAIEQAKVGVLGKSIETYGSVLNMQ
jgi:hypothetical protein